MDMQIAAADEYIEKHFPENKRLLNKVLKATKQSIKLTDPKTFKSEDGVFTTSVSYTHLTLPTIYSV